MNTRTEAMRSFGIAVVTGAILWAQTSAMAANNPLDIIRADSPSANSSGTNRLDRAFALKDEASQGKLEAAGLAEAGALLADPDLFVQGVAEWAIATQVGIDNNPESARWPKAEVPDWYRAWCAIPQMQRVEMDWVRQAVALGFYNDPAKLLASVAEYLRRTRGLQAAPGLDAERKGIMERTVVELARLNEAMAAAGSDPASLRALWLEARRALRPAVLAQAGVDFDRIVLSTVFAPHHAPNIVGTHTAWTHKPGGDLCLLSGWRTGATELRPILAGKLGPGHVHGLDLWFEADRLVFAWARQEGWPRPGNSRFPADKGHHHEARLAHEPTHLYEIGLDSSGLRQLTSDPYWTDLEPVWLPDGGIAFTSDRCAHGVICDYFANDEANLNIYALRPGGDIRRLTNNKDLDRYPCLLNNGLIAYTRWEYQERHFWDIHSLWTVRPDGTMADALFKQHLTRPMGLRDARAIPGSGKLVAIATGHHSYAIGPLVLADPAAGINNPEGLRNVSPGVVEQEHKHGIGPMKSATVPEGGLQDAGGFYQTPCALSEGCFLVGYSYATGRPDHLGGHPEGGVDSNGMGLYLVDVFGNKELLYRDPLLGVMYPMPVKRRPRPTVNPDLVKPSQPWATCVLSDVYHNIGPEVKRGTVKWLRLSEALPWPLDAKHGSYKWPWGSAWEPNAGQTSWNPVRVIGLVPVEADGSAHFQVPPVQAGSVYFQALDENFMEIRRMRSNVSFQPGEVRSCYGCHESQGNAPATISSIAAAKPAVRPVPPSWGADRAIGYEWMIQPILDRHCVSCHGEKEPKAKLDLSARKMPTKEREMNQSYLALMGSNILGTGNGNGRDSFVWISNRFSDGSVSKAYQFGSTRSKLAQMLLKGHHKVKLDADEWLRLVTWIDANAPYHDRFIDKRPADGGEPRRDAEFRWPDPFGTTQEVDWVRVDTKASQGHAFVGTDPRMNKVVMVTAGGEVEWEYPCNTAVDVAVLSNGNFLVSHIRGAQEVTRDKKVVWEYRAPATCEVFSCQSLPDGNVLVAECGTKRLVEVDRAGKVTKEIPLKTSQPRHNQFRIVRKTAAGTYLVACHGDHWVQELDAAGKVIRTIRTPGNPFMAERLENGNTLIACGDGHKLIEVDLQDHIVWQLNEKDLPGHPLRFVGGFQRLPNGNLLLCNWPCHGFEGKQPLLVEVTRGKKAVWQWSAPGLRGIAHIGLLPGNK